MGQVTGGELESPRARAPGAEGSSAITSPCISEPRTEDSQHVGPKAHEPGNVRVLHLSARAGAVARAQAGLLIKRRRERPLIWES